MKHLLFTLALCLLAAGSYAASYPDGLFTQMERYYNAGPHEIGEPVWVFTYIYVEDPGPLSNFYYSEQFPQWISVYPDVVTINGVSCSFTFERGSSGDALEGHIPYRWILDSPSDDEGTILAAGDHVLINYILYGWSEGLLTAEHDGWFGSFELEGYEVVFGDDGNPMVLQFGHSIDAPENTPAGLHLAAPFPNPFNPSTRLTFSSDAERQLELDVVDITGRIVRHLASGRFPSGVHEFTWNGRDNAGAALPSGMYFARLNSSDGFQQSQKLMLLK